MNKLDKLNIVLERALEKQKETENEYDSLVEQQADLKYKLKENAIQQSHDYCEVVNAEKAIYAYEEKENKKLGEK